MNDAGQLLWNGMPIINATFNASLITAESDPQWSANYTAQTFNETSWIQSFYALTTDIVSWISGNKTTNDNSTWNESKADDLYVNVVGDTMTGALVINNNLTISKIFPLLVH